jgi:4-amino-4-deoxy-L-arabinose transferase-like glycosyltransferase
MSAAIEARDPSHLLRRLMTSPWLLAGVVLLSFFWQLGAIPLYDLDEGAFTEATREMLESGNYITPHKNGEPRYDKPILCATELAVADPENPGPLAVRATGRHSWS